MSKDEDYVESELIEYIEYIDHQFTSENMSGTGKDKNTTNKSNKGTNNSISFQYHLYPTHFRFATCLVSIVYV